MKFFSLIRIVVFLVGTGLFGALHAQNSPASLQARRDSLLNPSLMKQAERVLRFEKSVQNIGTLTEDDVIICFNSTPSKAGCFDHYPFYSKVFTTVQIMLINRYMIFLFCCLHNIPCTDQFCPWPYKILTYAVRFFFLHHK